MENSRQAKESTRFIYINPTKTYLENCFSDGCKLEHNNPCDHPEKPQKGIVCIAFPLYFSNAHRFLTDELVVGVVPPEVCPLVKDADVIHSHCMNGLAPVIRHRFPQIKRIRFQTHLADLIGMHNLDL